MAEIKNGKIVLIEEEHTAGAPAKIELLADRRSINADGKDLSFITVKVLDANGNMVPDADNLVNFKITGAAQIAGTDNGSQISMESFKTNHRKAFHGMCLLIAKAKKSRGTAIVYAQANGLQSASLALNLK